MKERVNKFRFLSNFYMAPIEYEGQVFPSSEHAYQAAKTEDKRLREVFTDINMTAAESKRAGQKIDLRSNWDTVRIQVMRDVVRIKFKTHAKLAEKLLATGDEELIEGNTWGDRFFGQVDGVGENWLGRILMEVRGELRANIPTVQKL